MYATQLQAYYPGITQVINSYCPLYIEQANTTIVDPIHKPKKPPSSMPSASETKPSLSAVALS